MRSVHDEMFGRIPDHSREQVVRHLRAEHGQGLPKHLMRPAGEPLRAPSAPGAQLNTMVRAAPTHIVPRYDVYGFPLPDPPPPAAARAIRAFSDQTVPAEWERRPRHPTKTSLQADRRQNMRPHSSYDVDGDGFVSQRDYSIAFV